MKYLIPLIGLLLLGCSSNKLLSQDDKKHLGVSFVLANAFTYAGFSERDAFLYCLGVGTAREGFKHIFKDVQFGVDDTILNTIGCALGTHFSLTTDGNGTTFINYTWYGR